MTVDDFIELIDDNGQPAPGASEVAAFETEHGLTLPDDYRAFLAATPGGRVQHNVLFSLSGETEGQEIMGTVAGLNGEGFTSLNKRLADVEEDAIPEDLLPIMRDRGGNTIAMVLRPDRFGEIVILDHEVSDEGRSTLEAAEADDWGYAIPFARSFTDLITGCRFEPR